MAQTRHLTDPKIPNPPSTSSHPTSPLPLLLLLLILPPGFISPPSAVAASPHSDPIINTESGRVRGERTFIPFLDKTVDVFLGIPFAKPPLGHLRFRHPKPIEAWTDIFNATRAPKSCYQEPDVEFGPDFWGSNVWNSPTPLSEDCLYLNVYVPRPATGRVRKAAVLVWIYGGGFYSGTTTLGVYDGKVFAAETGVIVVSIAYRVGALGFLGLGHPSAPGNQGMFDQLMGLEWVQQNIGKFGGDPNNVTLCGESAGSVSVSLHLLSPLSHSKFQRAILQSGAATMPWATLSVDESRRRAIELAVDYLDCPSSPDPLDVSNCLRLTPAERLVETQWVSRGPVQFPFLPVIDGVFLTDSPTELMRRRAFKRCPILIGSNQNEGSTFVMYELKDYVGLERKTMSRAQYVNSMEKLFYYHPQYPAVIEPQALKAITYQYSNYASPEDADLNLLALDMAMGDSQFICPINEFARNYAVAGLPVYSYVFSQRYSSNPWPAWTGVLHGDEIFFMLGEALRQRTKYTEDEKQLSRQMMRQWSNFAKTGNPNLSPGEQASSRDPWPLHTPDGREYLELHTRHLGATDRWGAIGMGPRAKECAFWGEYLPELISTAGQNKDRRDEPKCNHQCAASRESAAATSTNVLCVQLVTALTAVSLFLANQDSPLLAGSQPL